MTSASRRKLLTELNKWCRDDSVLIITERGLQRLRCPFWEQVIEAVHIYREGQLLMVKAVKVSVDLRLVYKINNVSYYHYCFTILDPA